jgi:hypothetical protein
MCTAVSVYQKKKLVRTKVLGMAVVFLIYLDDQKWKGWKGNGMIKG